MENIKVSPESQIPDHLKGCLWSYDLKQLTIADDFKRIATNILVYGDLKATRWLFSNFSDERIASVLVNPLKGEWDAKSLNFWSGYLNVTADKKKGLKAFTNI